MKRKSEQAVDTPIAVGDEVLIDRGRIIYQVEAVEDNVAVVVQKSNIVGALAYAPRLKGGVGPAKVTRKVDTYRLNKVEG